MPRQCACCTKNAVLKRPKTGDAMCKDCFFFAFEEEIHHTITDGKLFNPGDHVAIGASGGKDSTVLAYVMKLLNDRHGYGLTLELLSIDEGITGYRDDSLETVKRNKEQYGLSLKILSYKELYGWTMDDIVKEIGKKNNCTFCGVFRRQALDRGAMLLGCNKVVTGHNADDIAETVIMNSFEKQDSMETGELLRGDVARLQRCTAITTGSEGTLPRCKPFKYTYEKEIVMYAYFKRLDYFSTECIYSPNAYRGHARAFIKDVEKIRPTSIIGVESKLNPFNPRIWRNTIKTFRTFNIIHSGESMSIKKEVKMPTQGTCSRCGYVSSQKFCKACLLLEGLNSGLPKLGIGKTDKIRKRASRTTTPISVDNGITPSLNHLPESDNQLIENKSRSCGSSKCHCISSGQDSAAELSNVCADMTLQSADQTSGVATLSTILSSELTNDTTDYILNVDNSASNS